MTRSVERRSRHRDRIGHELDHAEGSPGHLNDLHHHRNDHLLRRLYGRVVGDLAVGEQVSLALTSTTPQTVTKVTICLERVFGSVTAVAGNVITLSSFTARRSR